MLGLQELVCGSCSCLLGCVISVFLFFANVFLLFPLTFGYHPVGAYFFPDPVFFLLLHAPAGVRVRAFLD